MRNSRWLCVPALSLFLPFGPAFAAEPGSSSGVDVKALDTTVSPCQNFYQYACGDWRKNNPIPPDQSRWSRFNQLAERNLEIERGILEKAANPAVQRSAVDQKIGDYYASCMDDAAIDAKGIQPIQSTLDAIAKLSSKQELTAEIAELHHIGVRAFFAFGVRPDAKNSKEQIAGVSQGGLGLPDRDNYLRSDPRSAELRKQYQQTIRTMFELLAKAQGRQVSDVDAKVQAVMNIETALAKVALDRVALRNPDNTYHKMTVDKLEALTPDIAWNRFFKDSGLPPIQTLNVGMPDFMKGLNSLIDSTSLADIQTYLTWHVILSDAPVLPKPFRDADWDFFQHTLAGVKERPPAGSSA